MQNPQQTNYDAATGGNSIKQPVRVPGVVRNGSAFSQDMRPPNPVAQAAPVAANPLVPAAKPAATETATHWPNGQPKVAPAGSLASASGVGAPTATAPNMINGVRHEAQPVSVGNPLAAVGETLNRLVTFGSDDRIEARRATNRAELNGAPATAKPVAPANPIATKPGATLPASLDQLSLQDRQGAHMIANNLRNFSDKGGGIIQQKDAKGRTILTNVGTAGITDPNKAGNPLISINMAANNESTARANAIRQSMIDSQAAPRYDRGADSGGIKDVAREESQALMEKWGREDQAKQLAANPKAANAMAHLMAEQGRGDITTRGQRLQAEVAQANDATNRRGQDITAQTYANNLAGNPLDNLLKASKTKGEELNVASAKRIADLQARYQAEVDPTKRATLAEQLRVLLGKDKAANYVALHAAGGSSFDSTANAVVKAPDSIAVINQQTGQVQMVGELAPGGRPTGQAQGSSENVPSQAADMLRKNPGLAGDFDKKYGAGAAKQILGR